ncbi:MAG: hypothetical protein ABIN37_11175 [Burkholderiaceae bacterium]
MQRTYIATILLVGLLQMGCSPAFNWRDTALSPTPLHARFPCQPDKAVRSVALAGQPLELHMSNCSTAGVPTAVDHAGLSSVDKSGPVLQPWRLATLRAMAAREVVERPLVLTGIRTDPEALLVQAWGTGLDGLPLDLRAVWSTRDSTAFVAMVFGEKLRADVADTFLSGLRLQ